MLYWLYIAALVCYVPWPVWLRFAFVSDAPRLSPERWAAELARRRGEDVAIREAFDLRHPTVEQARRGLTRSWYAPPLPASASPGGALERWFLSLLDGEMAGERVRLVREGGGLSPYATCYGSTVDRAGTRWYLLDHATDGNGPRWRIDNDLVPASTFAASACPDPAGACTVGRAERERRWRVLWATMAERQ